MANVFLSRRNLITLINKLDSKTSLNTLIKCDTTHKKYPCSEIIVVTAIEDEDYYIDREAGVVLNAPTNKLKED